MHRGCALHLCFTILLALFGFQAAPAATLELLPIGTRGADTAPLPEIEVLSSDETGIDLRFSLRTLTQEEIAVGSQSFQSILIPGGGSRGAAGQPEVPTFTRFVQVPDRAGIRIEWSVEEEEEIAGIRLYPVQGDGAEGFLYDPAAYAQDGFQELARVETGPPAILRDVRVVPVSFQPAAYNPAQGSLRIATSIRARVSFDGIDLTNAKVRTPRPIPPSFEKLYRDLIVDYAPSDAQAALATAPGSWVLICRNDAAVTTRLQPLIDWRKRKGFPVVLATTAETGTTASSIKAWIQNAYDTWTTPPEYVVIAGDATGTYSINTWFENLSGFNGEGDHPYTLLEGNDQISDVHIGRLSFTTTTDLEAIVNKIVGYESAPTLQDPGWFQRACLVGDPYASGYSTVMVQQWIKDRLRDLSYAQIDTIYDEPFVTLMTQSLDQGNTIFSYRGIQGMSGWTNSNTYALNNGSKMPFVVTITCDTGSFANGTSRSEGFLRANGGANSPRGGIGAIGMSTSGTHTRYNNCVHYGIYRGLLFENDYTLGAALARGKLEMLLNYGVAQPNQAQIWIHWTNLMGDPALDCWTGFPGALTVQHPGSIPVGENAVTVTVLENGGSPSEGAQVCLLKGGETQSVGFTDAQGEVELAITPATAGDMLVTVSKHDRYPYMATVPVQGQSVYVGYQASTIDDDATGESAGNADGVLNPGETIELPVQLRNFGGFSAGNVTATLSTEDPFVTIPDGQETFGTIGGGGTLWSSDDFGIAVAADCPHGHTVRLGLDVTATEGQWRSVIELSVVSADLTVAGSTLYNAGPNGLLDPGETVQISVKLLNNGGASAQNVTGTLTSRSRFLAVVDGGGVFGTIGVGVQGENTSDRFSITAASDTYQGYVGTLQLDLAYSGGRTERVFVTVTAGQRTSDDPTGPDHYGYYAFDNTDVSYPETPVYAWVEIDPNFGGQGTQVQLTDNGTYQDDAEVVNLPFPFQYYGQSFTKATICSNGWLSMGSTWLTDYRNWTIPGAGGPDGMISVFWDDLHQVGNGHVFQYHDATNHRWIVQWSRMPNEPGSIQTVQAILYDPAFTPTTTGDGVIVLQYNQVNNSDSGDGYCTVGIESPDGEDGLLYTFHNLYAPGAANLAAGRAIRLVPIFDLPSGTLSGEVRNASFGDAPIAGAQIRILELDRTFSTAADGRYAGTVETGTFTVAVSHPSFAPDTASGVVIAEQLLTDLDFHLVDILAPTVVTQQHASTDDTAGPYAIPVTIEEYSGLTEKRLYYRLYGQTFTTVELQPQGGNAYLGLIPGQPYVTRVEYYVSARDSQGFVTTDPPAAPAQLYSFFVAPKVAMFSDDMETNKGWTVGGAGDTATGGIWERVDPIGTFDGGLPIQPENDHTPNPGTLCFVTDGRGGTEGDGDVDGGVTTLTSPRIDLTGYGTVMLSYYRWYTNDTGSFAPDDFWVAEISDDDGASWVNLENQGASDRTWRLMEFDLENYIDLTETVRLRFIASDTSFPSIVEAAVDDLTFLLTGVTDAPAEAGAAQRFELFDPRPNPSQAGAAIRFSLERPGEARLAVYDIQGRLVRRLVEGARAAGAHLAVWDGRDQRGARVASGIYLVKLEGTGRTQVRKLARLE